MTGRGLETQEIALIPPMPLTPEALYTSLPPGAFVNELIYIVSAYLCFLIDEK